MIEAVVLAAGWSSRTSNYKMTLPLGEKTVLEHTVDTLLQICSKVIVVAGHNADKCREVLKDRKGVKIITNPDFDKGMFSSVQQGVKELGSDMFFVIPGDQPMVRPKTLTKLLATDGDIVNPSFNGKKGHPVLFRNDCRKGILDMPKDGILRDFIHSRGAEIVEVEDEGILLDIDTDEDYEKIKRSFFEKE
ncbi:MAG: nucleotidyltransferase family protein [Clostridiales bacterium]|nr:nucleotidyltransferase family protein [Clostridiales bacterium]